MLPVFINIILQSGQMNQKHVLSLSIGWYYY